MIKRKVEVVESPKPTNRFQLQIDLDPTRPWLLKKLPIMRSFLDTTLREELEKMGLARFVNYP